MDSIIIDKRDFDFLIQGELESDVIKILQNESTIRYDSVYLSIDRELVGRILDFLEDELTTKGFERNDEPNEYGIMLEGLIDKFSREYYNK